MQRGFSITSDTPIEADQTVEVVVSYTHNGEKVESNTLTLTLKNSEETKNTLNGDQLVQADPSSSSSRQRRYSAPGVSTFVTIPDTIAYRRGPDGNLLTEGGTALVTDNVLYGSGNDDTINGLTGNDALDGNVGNDTLGGGEGDDLIAGGPGNDTIYGGAGNDFISSSAYLFAQQQLSPNDRFASYDQPPGTTLLASGATWGIVQVNDSDIGAIWFGISDTPTDEQSDVIDAGAGDDRVIASWGNDRVQGGDGNDIISGLAGDDVLEGGDGDDQVNGDGTLTLEKLETVEAARHGADFIDGGAGADFLEGGGGADQVFGGSGNDELYGDSGVATNDLRFIPFEFHGADYLDGEGGDDYIEGDDQLWGDTSVDNLANPNDSALNAGAWANHLSIAIKYIVKSRSCTRMSCNVEIHKHLLKAQKFHGNMAILRYLV